MRVGLIVPGFSADSGDWCIPAVRHLARALAAQDDLRVIAVRYPYRAARYTVDGAEVIALGGAARRGAGTLGIWARTLDLLRSEHRRRPFDVLHAFWATESGLLTAIGGRVLGVPTVVSVAGGELVSLPDIGYGDQRFAWERLKIRASLRLASAVTAGSYQLLGLAAEHVPQARLHRAPLGVDTELFKPGRVLPTRYSSSDRRSAEFTGNPLNAETHAPTPESASAGATISANESTPEGICGSTAGSAAAGESASAGECTSTDVLSVARGTFSTSAPASEGSSAATRIPSSARGATAVVGHARIATDVRRARVVHVATLTPVKDQATLLRAFAMLRQHLPAATLDIVGSGPLRAALERLAGDLRIAEAVQFRGDVDHAALPAVYGGGDAFVLSSRHEAQSMVAIEAAACGLPIVGTRVGVLPELATSEDALVPVGAVDALAEALRATLTMGSDAFDGRGRMYSMRARARAEFGLAPCVARFRALYARVTEA